jgi:hypothetical protein
LHYVNDTSYLVYAENVTKDGLELYYTRIKRHIAPQTEVCVSVRNKVTDTFSLPSVIYTNPSYIIEAPTLTTDKTRLYYHKKMTTNFKLYLRYRNSVSGINEVGDDSQICVYPNPSSDKIYIKMQSGQGDIIVDVYDVIGRKIMSTLNATTINVLDIKPGLYSLVVKRGNKLFYRKFSKI